MRRARLNIHLQKQNLDEDVDRGAVARVIPVSRDTRDTPKQVVVPAGRGTKYASVDVEPGQYVVETRLPSGRVVRQNVDVHDDKETKNVALESPPSLAVPARPAKAGKGKATVHMFAVDRLRADSWNRLAALARTPELPTLKMVRQALGAGEPTPHAPHEQKDRVTRYVWNDGPTEQQTIAVIERRGTLELVALPVPWMTKSYKVVEVECAVPADPEEPLSIMVRDPELGAVIGNLAAGALGDARMLWGDNSPLDWLDGKRRNQYAAALGACVLVKADTSGKRQPWDDWIDNLTNWFDWLPDGAALQSVRRLRLARGEKALKGVHASVTETLRRGIPIIAPVASMFLDTLATLVEHEQFDSTDIEDQYRAVRSVMLRMQSGQTFTLLRFERKGKRAR